jgi:signal transduction histidine kinase/DNA-binding response OmpR family regulator
MIQAPLKILLVEDNPGDARLIREMLAKAGTDFFTIEWSPTLAAGLERLSRSQIDLVLLDLGLPDSLGLDTFIKAYAHAPQVPFVVLSGLSDESLALTAVRQGAQDYLFKDETDSDQLLRAIRYATERKQAELALEAERKKLYAVLNSLPAYVYLNGADYAIRFANRRFTEAFGEPGNKPCYEILWSRSEPCEPCPALEVLKTKTPQKREWTSPLNGRAYEVYNYPFCGEDEMLVLTLGLDITTRQVTENALQWELAVKTALADLSNALISRTSSYEVIADLVLVHAKNLTKSDYGFVTAIDPLTGDNIAYTLPRMMGEQCRVSGEYQKIAFSKGPDGLYAGLWGHALNTLEAFFTNSPGSHPAAKGIPTGHIPLNNFLSVPAIIGERLVGQVALANSPQGYTDRDLQAIQRLAKFYALALQRQQAEEKMRESEQNLRYLASQLLNAQERERERISRELHDELGQSVLVLKLQAGHIEKRLNQDQADIKKDCHTLMQQFDRLVGEVRRLARDLSPTMVRDLGLASALRRLIQDFSRHYGIQAEIDLLDGLDELLSREAQINIYRIFQESLTNIGKYAQASQLKVTSGQKDGVMFFRVADNGKGFRVEEVWGRDPARRGLGLMAMEERVRMLGGTLEIKSGEGQGTQLSLIIPTHGHQIG